MSVSSPVVSKLVKTLALVLCLVTFVAGCSTTKNAGSGVVSLDSDNDGAKVVLMPLDVELSLLTASGLTEPNAEWTENAIKFMTNSIKGQLDTREAELLSYAAQTDDPESKLVQLERLHQAVGYSILVHHVGGVRLPSKKGVMDWTLGADVKVLKAETGADHALFIFVRDSYASGGRVAAQIGLAILGVGMQGGIQIGFASLVDLNSGEIVWFNRLISTTGDLRKPAAAEKTVNALLKGFPRS